MKKVIVCSFAIASMLAGAESGTGVEAPSVSTPKATVSDFVQLSDRTVVVTYSLANPPAVVTFAAETNGPNGWVAMDGKCLSTACGDVFRRVTGETGTFNWNVDGLGISEAIAAGNLRVKLTAWRLDDTPDYMVVSLASNVIPEENRVRYYTSTNELPGGLLGNHEYRKSMVVMKRMHARGVRWMMGSPVGTPGRTGDDAATGRNPETMHPVTLTNDYYIGVFPLTVAQMVAIYYPDQSGVTGGFPIDRAMRICDRAYYRQTFSFVMRNTNWPDAPDAGSVLGKMRALTAGAIDDWELPTEAQWEFAAKANQPVMHWGNGKEYKFEDAYPYTTDYGMPGRYRYNQANDWHKSSSDYTDEAKRTSQGPESGTPIAGSYAPNAYGLYDMHGGIWEWCLDWYSPDITALDGRVNIDPSDGTKTVAGAIGANRVMRGGCYLSNASVCRASYRKSASPRYPGDSQEGGARLCCRAGLK